MPRPSPKDPRRLVSAASYLEAANILESRFGDAGGRELDPFGQRAGIAVVEVTAEQADIARHAWRTCGKGRHPAGLDYGVCFPYAFANSSGEPLLFKGDDFAKTDVVACRTGPE